MGVVTVKKMGGSSESIEVGNDASVSDLKSLVAPVFDVPAELQKLLLKGKPLADTKSLKDYGATDGVTITLVVLKAKKKGGAGGVNISRGKSAPPPISAPPSGMAAVDDELSSSSTAPNVDQQAAAAAARAAEREETARRHLRSAEGALAAAGGVGLGPDGAGVIELELATMLEGLEKHLGGPMAGLLTAVGTEGETTPLQQSAAAMTDASKAIASLLT